MKSVNHITIIGAGLSGTLLAIMLKKFGYTITIIEKRGDLTKTKFVEGRSINLALSHRGIKALKSANVLERVKTITIPMKGRMIHYQDKSSSFQSYGKENQCIYSVSRIDLNKILIEETKKDGIEFIFNSECRQVDLKQSQLSLFHDKKETLFKSDLIIGADGAFSTIRKAYLSKLRFNYEQHYIDHGYKEITMPPKNNDFAMSPNYLHIWPCGQFMLIALPNLDKSFTCTLFLPFEGELSFQSLKTKEQLFDFFNHYFPDTLSLIPNLESQFFSREASSMVTVKCFPWHFEKSFLIGDAAHAVLPFYGQGMNSCFEDCRLLIELAKELDFDWENVFKVFSENRKKDTDAIADLTINNFLEMRDLVKNKDFLERKKVEQQLHEKFGDEWLPLYSMVTFSDMPYSETLKKGIAQEQALIKAQKEGFLDDLERIKNLINY